VSHYYLDLFSLQTFETFTASSSASGYVTGFRKSLESAARRIREGDKLLCYVTGLSRWCGVLEVTAPYFVDHEPLFLPTDDPFVIRFRTKPLVWLRMETAVPIQEDDLWPHLSFTRDYPKWSTTWTGRLRNSLNLLSEEDGSRIEEILKGQAKAGKVYEIDDGHHRRYVSEVRRRDKVVTVTVPEERPVRPARESYQIQSLLALVGEQMGFTVWLPRQDRQAVLREWQPKDGVLLQSLPLNYDDATIRTIEQIDVLWIRNRTIVRAFEVEHATPVYSGILRLADLMALQPNLDLQVHIVAPLRRRDRVFQQITRPVFSLIEKGPLSQLCTFVSYDAIRALSKEKHLCHLKETVLDEIAETGVE
jgi:predicted RNA-binding protein